MHAVLLRVCAGLVESDEERDTFGMTSSVARELVQPFRGTYNDDPQRHYQNVPNIRMPQWSELWAVYDLK